MIKILSPLILPANLSSAVSNDDETFKNRIHVFLTCLAVSRDLKNHGLDKKDADFFEELSLKCIYKSLMAGNIQIWQLQLLIDELVSVLKSPYPIVTEIKNALRELIGEFMNHVRMKNDWTSYKQLGYLHSMLDI